jgi:CO/xanthine dehydrogenase Mo-binding subunit
MAVAGRRRSRSGRLDPMIAEGQVHGGIAQGVAQALLERVVYDDDGNLTTSNFMDYQVISAVGHARRSRVCSPKYLAKSSTVPAGS